MASVEVAAATHLGRRRVNADVYLLEEAAGFFAVADGMGDFSRSRHVARAALKMVCEFFMQPWALLPLHERSAGEATERLGSGLVHAHVRLQRPALPRPFRIGTTFAGAVVCADSIVVGHIGDSRAYLLRACDGRLSQLTEDHTIAGEARRRGVRADRAGALPRADDLTQALGATRAFDPRPVVRGWEPGDIALLCTDGVSDHLDATFMANAILDASEPETAAHRLVSAAAEVGGWDNATVVLVRRKA